jgi:hypothetical protein
MDREIADRDILTCTPEKNSEPTIEILDRRWRSIQRRVAYIDRNDSRPHVVSHE